jgi:phosphoglycerate-specific signal transduction histidine kinase
MSAFDKRVEETINQAKQSIEKTKQMTKDMEDLSLRTLAAMIGELRMKNDYLEQHIVSLTERLAKIESQVNWNFQYCLSEIAPIKESLRYKK